MDLWQQLVALARKRHLHPVGKKTDSGHPTDCDDQRKYQHAQLARAPVASKHAKR